MGYTPETLDLVDKIVDRAGIDVRARAGTGAAAPRKAAVLE